MSDLLSNHRPTSPPRSLSSAFDRPSTQGSRSGLPHIEHSPIDEPIHVAAGGPLVVPREDIDADIDDGSELDLKSMLALQIRKPGRREWIALDPELELSTRLVPHKPRPDAFDVEYFHVEASLRGPIEDELKRVRVFPYYSFSNGAFALWIIHVTLGHGCYESLASLLRQPPNFFAENKIRVIWDRTHHATGSDSRSHPGRGKARQADRFFAGRGARHPRLHPDPGSPGLPGTGRRHGARLMPDLHHGEIWSIDTEWGFRSGRTGHESAWEPVVLCLVGLRSGRRLHFWTRDGRLLGFSATTAATCSWPTTPWPR